MAENAEIKYKQFCKDEMLINYRQGLFDGS